jgi:hypothetical protein
LAPQQDCEIKLADGLSWRLGDRVRTETDLRLWLAEHGAAGSNQMTRSG